MAFSERSFAQQGWGEEARFRKNEALLEILGGRRFEFKMVSIKVLVHFDKQNLLLNR